MDCEAVTLLKDLSKAIQEQSPKTYEILQTLYERGLEQSPEIMEFVSSNNWNFIIQLNSLIPTKIKTDRKVKLLAMQVLISLGNMFPPIWKELSQKNVLTDWVYDDLQVDDDEICFFALTFFSHFLSIPLPTSIKNILGFNLVSLLIDFVIQRDEEGDNISAEALNCLIKVSDQFDSSSFTENKVLDIIYDHEEKSELGQRFISYINRSTPDELYYIARMIKTILNNQAMAESFFYTNDLKVLLDVIIRELNDLPAKDEDGSRQLHLQVLEPFVRNTSFRNQPFRTKELKKALVQFHDYKDKEISKEASRILQLVTDYETICQYTKKNLSPLTSQKKKLRKSSLNKLN